ncbi:MAG: hypothetical protein GY857_14100 [Desulfobacula sp.]|nr:hypothetical protein [Desulfobacula sp.]
MSNRQFIILVIVLLFGLNLNSPAECEPFRLLVTKFAGPAPVSHRAHTTVYFEMIKAFKSIDNPDKGAWILYGMENLEQQNHDAALLAAGWPSVRADLAIWGQVHIYDDGVVVQLYLTLTPLIKKRRIRPELWHLNFNDGNVPLRLELDIPGKFYQFEPFLLPDKIILAFENPQQGIEIYSKRQGGQVIGTIGEVMRFYEIHENSILLNSDGVKGWVRIKPILQRQSEAIDFSKGVVRLLRGDWRGSRRSFNNVLNYPNLPQHLRTHALIYIGLAKEKAGKTGLNEFKQAYSINPLNKVAAAYLLMGRVSKILRLKKTSSQKQLQNARYDLQKTLSATRFLFEQEDPWIAKLKPLL